jgi:pimeloyl-ACP methyl ester carboxylesterase
MITNINYKNTPLCIHSFYREGLSHFPTVVFFHGLGCSKDDFLYSTEREDLKDFPLLGIDLPGFGESQTSEENKYSTEDFSEIIHIFLQKQKIQKIILVGHSMGGRIALLYAKKYPQNIEGFASVEGNMHPENCIFSEKVYQNSFEDFSQKIFPNLIENCQKSKNKGFQYYAKVLQKYSSLSAFYYVCPSLVEGAKKSLIEDFLNLECPKIFIHGSENHFSYLPVLQNSSCAVNEIPESNHFPYIDNPNFFYKTLSHFLDSLLREAQSSPERSGATDPASAGEVAERREG